jgi:hypothetical protein
MANRTHLPNVSLSLERQSKNSWWAVLFWRESEKSQEREGSALASMSSFPYDAAAVFVRQLRGPHLSTWP